MKELDRESNAYNQVVEHIGIPVVVLEADSTISYANSRFANISGFSKEEIEGKKRWTDFASQKSLESLKYKLQYQEVTRLPSTEHEFDFMDKHGRKRRILVNIDYLPGTQKTVASLFDITDRRIMEKSLQQERDYWENIFLSSVDAISVVNNKGRFKKFNKAFLELLGYSYQELISKKVFDLYPNKKQLEAMLNLLRRQGQISDYEMTMQRKNKTLLPLALSISLLKDKNQTVIGSVGVARDLTDRKLYEQKLQELSMCDSLTGLYNRTFFQKEMQRLNDGRYSPIAIVICDVDGLKLINDSMGHHKGDALLKEAADLFKKCFRKSDIVARIGGDEFAALLPSSDFAAAQGACARIRKSLEFYNADGPEMPLTLSIGHSVGFLEDQNITEVFIDADNCMYKEKIQMRRNTRSEIVRALIKNLEANDYIARGHSHRVQQLALKMGKALEFSEVRLKDLQLLCFCHDLGKVGISDRILCKTGSLTEEEYKEMKLHCEIGQRIATSAPELEPVADYILKFHEWWNGEGYPLGLQGEDIPLECRILAIVESYDAMTSDRPYREAMTHSKALSEIERRAGTQFDPDLVPLFLSIAEKEIQSNNQSHAYKIKHGKELG